jgi:hypothetical protein
MQPESAKKYCQNCDFPMSNSHKFCTNCGQKDLEKKLNIKDFVEEFFANFYAFDSKVLTSLRYLMTKPGIIAKEFVNGKRLKFVNPFKLLLSLAIILGLLISLLTFLEEINNNKTQKVAKEEYQENIKIEDSLATIFSYKGISINEKSGIEKKPDTTWLDKKKNIFYTKNHLPKENEINRIGILNKWNFFHNFFYDFPDETYQNFCVKNNYTFKYWDKLMFEKIQMLNKENFKNQLISTLKSNFPYFLFFCLIFFALLMYLFFYRSGYNFTEHLIFIFYLFSFYLLPFILITTIDIVFVNNYFTVILFFVLFIYNWIYFYKSLKNFYLQKNLIFKIKFVLLSFIMPLLLVLSLLVVLILSVLLS